MTASQYSKCLHNDWSLHGFVQWSVVYLIWSFGRDFCLTVTLLSGSLLGNSVCQTLNIEYGYWLLQRAVVHFPDLTL